MRGHQRRHPRLFWRVYLNGIVLLLLVAAALAVVGAALGRGQWARNPERLAAYVAGHLGEARSDPERLAAELSRVREALAVEIALYRDDGGLVAASDASPPPPLDPAERARLAAGPLHEPGRRWSVAARLSGTPPAYVVMAGSLHPQSFGRPAAFLAAVLFALAIASIPLARGIAAPLEKLTAAARALGSGDLSARSGIARGDEVGELSRAFDEMAERLERLVRSEKELLANVSHELRTPLARIRVAVELAAEGDLDRAHRYLGEMAADLGELGRLVDDILTAARLDLAAGKSASAELPLRREPVDASELVARAADRFRAAHPDRPLDVALSGPLPSLDGDPALLRRVLENLLDNAHKYSEAGTPVALSARAEDGALVVEVRDRGIGVDASDLPRLFTPFFRTDRSRARGTGGVGLGLALARRIVEAHGGRIAAESVPGQGTVVRFSVPGPA